MTVSTVHVPREVSDVVFVQALTLVRVVVFVQFGDRCFGIDDQTYRVETGRLMPLAQSRLVVRFCPFVERRDGELEALNGFPVRVK